ncbi:MAG: hypothetical protein HY819_16760 [Acidobacteria bacterium]|nr:hypothetical protein [Acidobacteriota bacterium]
MSIENVILAHAEEKKPRFAGRMALSELPINDLPRELRHFSIEVDGIIDYLPMHYLVTGDSFYSSLDKGDFANILEYFQLLDSVDLTAMEVAQLYLLLEFPSRGRVILLGVRDLELPFNMPAEVKTQLGEIIAPPVLHRNSDTAQCAFYLFNGREGILEEVLIEVTREYKINHGIYPIANLWANN